MRIHRLGRAARALQRRREQDAPHLDHAILRRDAQVRGDADGASRRPFDDAVEEGILADRLLREVLEERRFGRIRAVPEIHPLRLALGPVRQRVERRAVRRDVNRHQAPRRARRSACGPAGALRAPAPRGQSGGPARCSLIARSPAPTGTRPGHAPRRAQMRRRGLGNRRRHAGLDPHRVEAGGARPCDVGLERVADHDHARRAEAPDRVLEDRRVRLAEPHEAQVGRCG